MLRCYFSDRQQGRYTYDWTFVCVYKNDIKIPSNSCPFHLVLSRRILDFIWQSTVSSGKTYSYRTAGCISSYTTALNRSCLRFFTAHSETLRAAFRLASFQGSQKDKDWWRCDYWWISSRHENTKERICNGRSLPSVEPKPTHYCHPA